MHLRSLMIYWLILPADRRLVLWGHMLLVISFIRVKWSIWSWGSTILQPFQWAMCKTIIDFVFQCKRLTFSLCSLGSWLHPNKGVKYFSWYTPLLQRALLIWIHTMVILEHKSTNTQAEHGAFTSKYWGSIIRNGQNSSYFRFSIRKFHPISYLTLQPPLGKLCIQSRLFVSAGRIKLKLSDRFPLNLVEGWGKEFQTECDEIFRSGGIQLSSGAPRLSL